MSTRTWGSQPRYRIIRRFYSGRPPQRRGLPSGLTLAQAQAHCSDINTSSLSCWTTSALARTKRYGAWFDGYEQM